MWAAIPRLQMANVNATIICLFVVAIAGGTARCEERRAQERAVAFLAREVPKWQRENKCFSCHNNGDGARALYEAKRLGYRVDEETLKATTAWLARPDNWDQNGGKAEFSDKKLAAIQFSSALVAAVESGSLAGPQSDRREALAAAAKIVATSQEDDGAWQIDAQGVLGSPVTYGAALATAASRRVLVRADPQRYARHIARADQWLLAQRPKSMPDAAAVLLGLAHRSDAKANEQRSACLELLAKGQDKSGGWGPHLGSAPEPFDTALALLALSGYRERPGVSKQISRGRQFLIETQLSDGSWVETTRPAGAESYAQRISTTAWATLALLASAAR